MHKVVLARASSVLHAMLGSFGECPAVLFWSFLVASIPRAAPELPFGTAGFAESTSRVLYVQGVPAGVFYAFLAFLYTRKQAAALYRSSMALYRLAGGKDSLEWMPNVASKVHAGEVEVDFPDTEIQFPMKSQSQFEYYVRLLQVSTAGPWPFPFPPSFVCTHRGPFFSR